MSKKSRRSNKSGAKFSSKALAEAAAAKGKIVKNKKDENIDLDKYERYLNKIEKENDRKKRKDQEKNKKVNNIDID